jgi:hypothetical protein
MLEEKVVLAFVVEKAVGIIHPIAVRGEMHAWAESFAE